MISIKVLYDVKQLVKNAYILILYLVLSYFINLHPFLCHCQARALQVRLWISLILGLHVFKTFYLLFLPLHSGNKLSIFVRAKQFYGHFVTDLMC